jgi:hypothetical protein
VNMIINLQAPYNVGKFLSIWVTVEFSRQAQLHGITSLVHINITFQHVKHGMRHLMLPCCAELEVDTFFIIVKDNFKQIRNNVDFNCFSYNPEFCQSRHFGKDYYFE